MSPGASPMVPPPSMATLPGILTVSESDASPAAIASEASSPVIIFVVLAGAQSRSGFVAPSTLPVARSTTIAARAVTGGSDCSGTPPPPPLSVASGAPP